MVSTPNKSYPLLATGDDPGTWGTVINAQVFSVIDLNFGGRNNLSVAGAVDVTLNATQVENIFQNYTGVLTGSISVIFPNAGGIFVVKNGTTGSFTLTVKPSSGTGFVVPQGTTMLVFINATTSAAVEVINYITALTVGTLGLTNALGVASGGTGAATLTAHGILLGEGTSAITPTAAMTDGQLLVGATGADPAPATVSGDATLAAGGAFTIANNAVSNAKLRQSVARSVVGNSTASTANVADIAAATDGQILRRNGTTIGFGTVAAGAGSGLGTAALVNTGTLGATIPLLNGINTWSGNLNTFTFSAQFGDISVVGAATVIGAFLTNSTITFSGLGTTASAANMNINAGTGAVLRSTSSVRYKTDIRDMSFGDAVKAMALRPVKYRSLAEADNKDWSWYGLVAEEVAEVEPRLVHWQEQNGELVPDGVAYDRLSVLLLSIVQRHEKEIERLRGLILHGSA